MYSELYAAEGEQKVIFPIIYEDINFEQSEKAMGVKYAIGGINWTFFRQGSDDYAASLLKLTQGLREKGQHCIYNVYVYNMYIMYIK